MIALSNILKTVGMACCVIVIVFIIREVGISKERRVNCLNEGMNYIGSTFGFFNNNRDCLLLKDDDRMFIENKIYERMEVNNGQRK